LITNLTGCQTTFKIQGDLNTLFRGDTLNYTVKDLKVKAFINADTLNAQVKFKADSSKIQKARIFLKLLE